MSATASESCSDCGHGKDRHAIWGPVDRCYACKTCWGWNPPAEAGERRARPAVRDADTGPDSDWVIRQWDGNAWLEVELVHGEAARDAALRTR